MSLIVCPDCGHEVSTAAVACANCGRPLADPTIERNVVIAETPPPIREEFPKWIFIPIAVLSMLLLFVLFYWMRNRDEATEVNVSVNAARRPANNTRETTVRNEPPNQVTIPPSDTTTVTSDPPPSSSIPQSSTVTNVPGESVSADKGAVTLDAKILTKTGGTQPVRNEKFYLLKKDLEEILSDADIEDETGQGLRNAFGLSVLYPDRYRETNQKARSAIQKYTVYSAQTDSNGKASIKDIKPDSYYLFGITKTKDGFAIWSSQVNITAGQNVLNLSPASITEAR